MAISISYSVQDKAKTLSPELRAWIARARANGWADVGATLLNALEPLSVLGAQALYMAQPFARFTLSRPVVAGMGEVAALLETPDGIALLHAALTDDVDVDVDVNNVDDVNDISSAEKAGKTA